MAADEPRRSVCWKHGQPRARDERIRTVRRARRAGPRRRRRARDGVEERRRVEAVVARSTERVTSSYCAQRIDRARWRVAHGCGHPRQRPHDRAYSAYTGNHDPRSAPGGGSDQRGDGYLGEVRIEEVMRGKKQEVC